MKTELRTVAHTIAAGANIFEVWHDGQFIATIVGAHDGPGVRIVSKHPMKAELVEGLPNVVEVGLTPDV